MKKDKLAAIGLVLCALFVIFVPVILVAQEANPGTGSTGVTTEVVSTQIVVSYFLSWLLQKIKKAESIPFFQEGATIANTVLAWIFAVAQTIGIGWTFDTAAGTLMITGLTGASVVEFARAYVTQKLMYLWAHRPTVTV